MSKVTGASLRFLFNSIEYPVESVTFDGNWEELDTTDSGTQTPATDFIVNRGKRTSKVDAILDAAHGATLVNNNLTALTKYLIVKGNITEGNVTYLNGTIFTSDGTGVATTSNQVAPLGNKLVGKDIVANIANGNVGVLGFKFNEAYGEYDSTDSTTTGDGTESICGRVKRTGSIDCIMDSATADLVSASPAATAIVLTFGPGLTLTGNAVFTKKSITSTAKGDMVKVTYDMTWVGPVVSTLANLLVPAIWYTATVKWKVGTSTDKGVTGTAIVMSRSLEADVHGLCKVSYGLSWVGAPTEAVAN